MPQVKKNIIIQKFGGSILTNVSNIVELSKYIKLELELGNFPIVVVSALFGSTNNILLTCNELKLDISNNHNVIKNYANINKTYIATTSKINQSKQFDYNLSSMAEIDVILSTLETFVSSTLAMCLLQQGIKAKSIQGWQLPISTNSNYGNANILNIKKNLLNNLLKNNIIPIVSGFQGIDENNNITTLGRGGSDITALAIAKIMKAKRVDIYKDVAGIMSADPKIVKNTKLIKNINYDIMYYMSYFGVKALNARSCEIAMKYKIPIRILSNYEECKQNSKREKSTLIMTKKKNNHIEQASILSITQNSNIIGLKIENCATINLIQELNDHSCNIIKITNNYIIISYINIELLNKLSLKIIENLHYIAIVGFGLTSNLIIKEIFNIAKNFDITMLDISITGINITILAQGNNIEKFIQKSHEVFIELNTLNIK